MHMTKYKNSLLSLASYILAFVVYYFEMSLFANAISTATSQATYSIYVICLMIFPAILTLVGIYFGNKSNASKVSKWIGISLLIIGTALLLVLVLVTLLGAAINGSEALSLPTYNIA